MKSALRATLLAAIALLLPIGSVRGEEAHRSWVEADEANGIYRFKWQAKSGWTYFIQHTEDLRGPWQWVPAIETGNGSVKEWGFASTAGRMFFRLQCWDGPGEDPENSDYDGDGIGNLWEVQHGQNPFRLESDGDGMSDAYEFAYGLNGAADDRTGDADGDGIPNGEDARPADNTIGRIAVSIDTPQNGASLP